jgi:hypothetical protein
VEIRLTYRGRIPSKRKDVGAVWEMRKSFSAQLEKLWGKEPFSILKEWEDSDFAAGAPRFTRTVGDHTFVPFYGRRVGIKVKLRILLLTGLPQQQQTIQNGDLDNRMKRVIDALRAVPQGQTSELDSSLPCHGRWYTLMDDDSDVVEVTAALGPYLESSDPSESFVLVSASPYPIYVSPDNIAMAL